MRCSHCGYIVPDDSDFCQYCGARIETQTECVTISNTPIDSNSTSTVSADEITQAQRYFDSDYGYSPENPIVTSSVQMVGFYLYALRTTEGLSFTWERQARQYGDMIDKYQLFVNGTPYKTVFFNPHGKDSDYVPAGLIKDSTAFVAAQKGLSLDEYQSVLASEEEARQIFAAKKKRTQMVVKRLILCSVILVILCAGGYFGVRYGVPYLKYQTAVRNMSNGNEEKAITTFVELGDYKDSKTLITESRYCWATRLFNEGNFIAAKEQFKSIKQYQDSKEMIQQCNLELGKQYMAKKDYKEAISLLVSVTIDDVDSLLAECYYNYTLELTAKKDWGSAYVNYNYTLKYDHLQTYNLEPYQYEIFTGFARWKIESGGESNCINAITAINSLIEKNGETEELVALNLAAEEALKEGKYERAAMFIKGGSYTDAVNKYAEILDYKDSKDQWLEAMYLFVQETKSGILRYRLGLVTGRSMTLLYAKKAPLFYEYSKILSENNYKDSKEAYETLISWKVITSMNNNPDDPNVETNSISKYDYMCVHVSVFGGPLEDSVKLKYVFTMPDGGSVSGTWDYEFENGDSSSAWCYYENPQYGSTGTCYVKIFNKETGKLLASDQIRVTA